MIRILGKKEEPGRPLLYGTSKDFLAFFGLKNLSQLPSLKEFHELDEEVQAQPCFKESESPIPDPEDQEPDPVLAAFVEESVAREESSTGGEGDLDAALDAARDASKQARRVERELSSVGLSLSDESAGVASDLEALVARRLKQDGASEQNNAHQEAPSGETAIPPETEVPTEEVSAPTPATDALEERETPES